MGSAQGSARGGEGLSYSLGSTRLNSKWPFLRGALLAGWWWPFMQSR